jgi:hypothetical protein
VRARSKPQVCARRVHGCVSCKGLCTDVFRVRVCVRAIAEEEYGKGRVGIEKGREARAPEGRARGEKRVREGGLTRGGAVAVFNLIPGL